LIALLIAFALGWYFLTLVLRVAARTQKEILDGSRAALISLAVTVADFLVASPIVALFQHSMFWLCIALALGIVAWPWLSGFWHDNRMWNFRRNIAGKLRREFTVPQPPPMAPVANELSLLARKQAGDDESVKKGISERAAEHAQRRYTITRGILIGLITLVAWLVYRICFDHVLEHENVYAFAGELTVFVPGTLLFGYVTAKRTWHFKISGREKLENKV